MKIRIGRVGAVLGACLMAAVMAADGALAGSVDTHSGVQLAEAAKKKKKKVTGKRLYGPRGGLGCIACHGPRGKKAIQDYPNIAGQDEKYLFQQMKDIMNGKRVGGLNAEGKLRTAGMKGALITPEGKPRMDKKQMKLIAKFLAKQKPAKVIPPETPIDPARLKQGKKLYKKLKCLTCHGKEGRKPQKGYPYVAGQKKAYIVAQMTDIRDKKRTNGKSKLMYNNMKKMTDEQIDILADYLSQIDRTAK